MSGEGCVVCGDPVSPKDGVTDRCGHHRRQLLRNLAKGLPSAPRRSSERRVPTLTESPLESLAPSSLKEDHIAGRHAERRAVACILCIRANGGRIDHIEMLREP